jgi:hypothetical protein
MCNDAVKDDNPVLFTKSENAARDAYGAEHMLVADDGRYELNWGVLRTTGSKSYGVLTPANLMTSLGGYIAKRRTANLIIDVYWPQPEDGFVAIYGTSTKFGVDVYGGITFNMLQGLLTMIMVVYMNRFVGVSIMQISTRLGSYTIYVIMSLYYAYYFDDITKYWTSDNSFEVTMYVLTYGVLANCLVAASIYVAADKVVNGSSIIDPYFDAKMLILMIITLAMSLIRMFEAGAGGAGDAWSSDDNTGCGNEYDLCVVRKDGLEVVGLVIRAVLAVLFCFQNFYRVYRAHQKIEKEHGSIYDQEMSKFEKCCIGERANVMLGRVERTQDRIASKNPATGWSCDQVDLAYSGYFYYRGYVFRTKDFLFVMLADMTPPDWLKDLNVTVSIWGYEGEEIDIMGHLVLRRLGKHLKIAKEKKYKKFASTVRLM